MMHCLSRQSPVHLENIESEGESMQRIGVYSSVSMLSLSETPGRGQTGQQESDVSGSRGRVFCIVGSRFITPLGQMLSQLFFVFVRLQSSVCLVISSETLRLYCGM